MTDQDQLHANDHDAGGVLMWNKTVNQEYPDVCCKPGIS